MTAKKHKIVLKALTEDFDEGYEQSNEWLESAIQNDLDCDDYSLKRDIWTIKAKCTDKQVFDFIMDNGGAFYEVISIDGRDWSDFYDRYMGQIRSKSKKGLGFAVRTPHDVIRGLKKYPHVKVWELCPNCENEVQIWAYGLSRCPSCGKEIVPCAMCDRMIDCNNCVYDQLDERKVRRR